MHKLPILCLLLLSSIRLHGQDYYIQIVGKERGLGLSGISAMIEDHEGMVWIGTQLGLLRFDGKQAYPFLPEKGNPNSLSNEYINDLFEDEDHNIWVATRNGLNKIDPSRKIITHFFNDTEDDASIPGNGIYKMAPATDSSFFIICARVGFAEFNRINNHITRLNPVYTQSQLTKRNYNERFIVDAWRTKRNQIFVRTNDAVYRYDHARNELLEVLDSISGFDVYEAYPDYCLTREGVFWVSDWQGNLYHWSPYEKMRVFKDSLITRAFMTGETVISDFDQHHILVSSPLQLVLVNKESGASSPLNVREDQRNAFASNLVRNSLETSKGIILMSASQGNLVLLDPQRQRFKYKSVLVTGPDGNAIGEVSDFYDDIKTQKRYISSLLDTFFYVQDLATDKIIHVQKKRQSNVVTRWFRDQQDRLWLCDGAQILLINTEDNSYTAYLPDTTALNLFDMVEIKPGVMLAATFRHGLFRFEPDQKIFSRIKNFPGVKPSQITCIDLDKAHQWVWIGTMENGLFRYDIVKDTFLHYKHESHNPKSLGGDWIRDITFDSSGYTWFATEPIGLTRYDYNADPDSAFLNLTMSDGLPSSYISGLCTDQNGNVWMTSLNGIATLDTRSLAIRQFGKTDGLPSSRFTKSSIVTTKDNWILIGTRNGYFYFNPNRLQQDHQPPEIVIRELMVFDKSHPYILTENGFEPVQLRYNQNYLTVQFSIINFTDPDRNVIKYMLEGLDDQWNFRTGITEINYTKIPPGEYRLRLVAANNDGSWNLKETIIPVVIRPAFWQTRWFYVLIGLIIAGIVFALYNYKLQQSIRQNRLIAEKEFVKAESERQLSQLEMTALRAQMNPHFIFNCLNSINRFIVVNDNEAASEYLTKFSKLIRQVLDNSRGEKVVLATEIDTLKLYIDMESLRFIDKFEYTITVDTELDTAAWVIQPMLIQPYVENAIWHGLMHRKSKGILNIGFTKASESLAVTIEDNGVGREKARQIKESQLVTRKSHGMKVTAQRMALLSKKLNVTVGATVEDLYDEENQSRGTCVHLTLPLEPAPVNIAQKPIVQS